MKRCWWVSCCELSKREPKASESANFTSARNHNDSICSIIHTHPRMNRTTWTKIGFFPPLNYIRLIPQTIKLYPIPIIFVSRECFLKYSLCHTKNVTIEAYNWVYPKQNQYYLLELKHINEIMRLTHMINNMHEIPTTIRKKESNSIITMEKWARKNDTVIYTLKL